MSVKPEVSFRDALWLALSRLKSFVGPHRYNPVLIFAMAWLFYASRFVLAFSDYPTGPERWRGFLGLAFALVPALAYSSAAWLIERFRFWSANKLRYYLAEVFITVAIFNYAFAPLGNIEALKSVKGLSDSFEPAGPYFLIFKFIFILVGVSAMHTSESKIQNRLAAASALSERLTAESRTLVLAEQELKAQVSRFLHDRIQSDLMTVSMRLQNLARQLPPESKLELEKSVERLEGLRKQDLRLAIESLSPNLEAISLESAIDGLVDRKFSDANLIVRVSESVDELNIDTKMALYKIVEQAVLNAQIHGEASQILVDISVDDASGLHLAVQDNGIGLQDALNKPGIGTAVIDSWARLLGGTKKVSAPSEGGYRLEIDFGLTPRKK